MKDTLTSPQVVAALITSFVAITLAVLPRILDSQPAAPTVIEITLTTAPTVEPIATEVQDSVAEATATSEPTSTPIPTEVLATLTPSLLPPTVIPASPTPSEIPPTTVPTEIPPSPSPANPPNALLLYNDKSFTVYNQSSQTLTLENVRFQSTSGVWDATSWGTGLVQTFPANNCLRMRDVNSASEQPPAICGTLLGLQLTSGSTLFWLNTDEFNVINNGNTIATCSTTVDSCEVYIP